VPTATSSKWGTHEATSHTWRVDGRGDRIAESPALAEAPPGQGLETFEVVCDDGPITVVGSPGDSASRWIDGQHMVLLEITFTPTGGAEIVIKTFGQKTGLAGNTVSCSVTDENGTTTLVRAPVPNG
jgi:hypothetical protein